MKAKELAEQLLKNPDFDIVFSVVDNPVGFGCNIRKFKDISIANIAHNNKTITLWGVEA